MRRMGIICAAILGYLATGAAISWAITDRMFELRWSLFTVLTFFAFHSPVLASTLWIGSLEQEGRKTLRGLALVVTAIAVVCGGWFIWTWFL